MVPLLKCNGCDLRRGLLTATKRELFEHNCFCCSCVSSGARVGLGLAAFDTQSGAFDSLDKGGDNLAFGEEMPFSNISFYYCEAYIEYR